VDKPATHICRSRAPSIWTLDIDELVEIARNELTQTLTDEECQTQNEGSVVGRPYGSAQRTTVPGPFEGWGGVRSSS
jgi:hypothetical protein